MIEGKRMTKGEFLRALESELEKPDGSVQPHHVLTDVEGWDSLAALLFISLADTKFGVIVSGDQIAKAKTVNDLLLLLGDRLEA